MLLGPQEFSLFVIQFTEVGLNGGPVRECLGVPHAGLEAPYEKSPYYEGRTQRHTEPSDHPFRHMANLAILAQL